MFALLFDFVGLLFLYCQNALSGLFGLWVLVLRACLFGFDILGVLT